MYKLDVKRIELTPDVDVVNIYFEINYETLQDHKVLSLISADELAVILKENLRKELTEKFNDTGAFDLSSYKTIPFAVDPMTFAPKFAIKLNGRSSTPARLENLGNPSYDVGLRITDVLLVLIESGLVAKAKLNAV